MKKKFIFVVLSALTIFSFVGTSLAGMLGLEFATANKIIDIILKGGTVISIIAAIATVAATGGVGAATIALAKRYVAKYGATAAATW